MSLKIWGPRQVVIEWASAQVPPTLPLGRGWQGTARRSQPGRAPLDPSAVARRAKSDGKGTFGSKRKSS